MSSLPEFKPIPTEDVESLLTYNDNIGVHTYGMWVVRAIEDPELVLVTRSYNSRIPMLPSWSLRHSRAKWRELGDSIMAFNPTGVGPKNTKVLPLYSNAYVKDVTSSTNDTYPIMPGVGEASVEDERRATADWYEETTLAATLEEKLAGNSLYAPYMQLCINALQLARQHQAEPTV